MPFTSTGTFTGNTYTAQLSNAAGSFTSPVSIGTLISDANSGTISATIPAGTAAGTGYRIRVVSNNPTVFGTNNTVDLTVQNSATITVNPSTSVQNLCQGNSATTLSVTATGTTLSYQWYSNTTATNSGGTPVGTNSASYTPSTATAGTLYYYCVVTAACGSPVTSNVSGSVTVNAIPVTPSGTITPTQNCGNTSLNYSAPSASLYWQTSATGTSTTFPTTSAYSVTTNGTYYVRAFNGTCWSTGTVSQAVTVINAIVISTQPSNQATTVGATATFSVTASNGAGYQWQINTGSGWSDISGATSASYTTPATTLAMSGYQYQVVVTGNAPCGNVTSSVAILTVTEPPCLTSSFTGWAHAYGDWTHSENGTWTAVSMFAGGGQIQMNDVGDYLELPPLNNPALLTYDAALSSSPSSNNRIKVQYFNGSVWVDVQEDTCTSTSFTTFTISFPPVVQVMPNVRVRLYRSADDRTHYIDNLNVYCGPTCTPPADPVGTISGVTPACNSTTLTYSESAVAPVEFYWQTTSMGTSTTNNANSPLVVTTSGDYYVRAFNTATSCWSVAEVGSYTVTINTPATITTQPIDASTIENGGASFTVATTGTGLSYQWQVDTGSGFVNVIDGPQYSGSNTASLSISNATLTMDGYVYQCVVTSACGNVTSNSATLSVIAATGTSFNPGELVFVGYDGQVNGSGGGAADEYLIATLVDMIPGTTFTLVNSRFEAGAPANVRTNKWGGGGDFAEEAPYVAELTYNGLTIIPAGSVLRFETNGGGNWFGTVEVTIGTTITDITADFSGSTNPSFSPNISTSGSDQMFLIQGAFTFDGTLDANEANYYLSGTLLHGITNRAAWVPLTDACNGGSSGGNSRESRLPSELTCFNVENASSDAVSAFYENDKEHGISTIRQIVLALSDVSNNWTLGTGRYTIDPASSSSTRAGKTFLIGPSNPPGQWVGNVNTNWFDCANWEGLAVPKLTTNVTISSSSVRDAQVDFTAPYSDLYSDIAVCNDITISDRKLIVEGNANNILNVYGNLVITATGVVDMDDSNAGTADGTIHLYGDWTNNVDETAFEEGNGTIHFDGTAAQIISNVAPEGTEIFYDVVMNNDFTTSVSNNLIATGDLLVVAGKTVTVNGNDYVQVNHDLTNNGIFNVLDDGSLIQVDDTGVNTGDISYERITTGNNLDYVYWSSPVEGANTPASGYIYSWNPTVANPNGGWGNWILSRNTSMASGVGYIMRDVFSRTFAGVARNGVVQPTIARANNTGPDFAGTNGTTITNKDDNWNLVGNPYPSAIRALDFITLNTNIEGAVRIWTHGTNPSTSISDPFYDSYVYNYTPNDYIVYNGTGTLEGPAGFNGFIAGGQSFMISMLDGPAATSTVTFNNAMRSRTYNNEQFYRTSNSSTRDALDTNGEEKNRIWLDIINSNNQSARTLVGYVTGATYLKDRVYDAVTNVLANVMNIYSVLDNERMTIQGRALPFDNTDKVQIAVNITTAGNYSIGIGATDGLFTQNQEIYLEDTELNIIHDLRTSPYTFSIASGEFKDRFVLRYTTETLSNEDFDTNNNDILVYSNETLNVTSNKLNIKAVTVYNVIGQLLENKKLNNTPNFVSSLVKGNQVLIVRVELENGVTVERKVIF
ncbi:hypothetical protein [Flavobacterium haoranii]|uniref:hypothetical protein n=1 Tax=Flavobacterium haoranii TaxID=683124 RepID=UPI001266D8B3|nr:hypothetical protein [Flavobacterium haoranii]